MLLKTLPSKRFSIILQGELIDTSVESDEVSCLYQCTLLDECAWYSFEVSFGTCLLLKDCPSVNEERKYLSGQVECQLESTTPTPTSSTTSSPLTKSGKKWFYFSVSKRKHKFMNKSSRYSFAASLEILQFHMNVLVF